MANIYKERLSHCLILPETISLWLIVTQATINHNSVCAYEACQVILFPLALYEQPDTTEITGVRERINQRDKKWAARGQHWFYHQTPYFKKLNEQHSQKYSPSVAGVIMLFWTPFFVDLHRLKICFSSHCHVNMLLKIWTRMKVPHEHLKTTPCMFGSMYNKYIADILFTLHPHHYISISWCTFQYLFDTK